MALNQRIEYLRKEHEELLNLAGKIEKALESASKNDVAEHLKSLNELRSLEHGLTGIVEHCHAEDRIVESTYHQSLQKNECDRINAEHEQIIRAVTNFREELKFATTDRTMAMIIPGMDVVNLLRTHIAYEREMLGRITELRKPTKSAAGKKQIARRAQGKKKRHAAKRKTETKAADVLPYTLEPHPEL
jgi:hemerythrin-like domain-containing protein